MAKKEIFNDTTQEVEVAELSVDQNNEIVAEFKNGHFVKFPAGLDKKGFQELIDAHHALNEGQEIVTPEMEAEKEAERAASLALIGEDDGPKPVEKTIDVKGE